MRVLVTRPEPEATRTAELLRRLGHEPVLAPMTAIVADRAAAIPTAGVQAVAATSARALDALAGRAELDILRRLPLHAVGDATAAAARRLGFARVASAAGTVDDLAAAIRAAADPAAGAILYLAGRDRTGDLAGALGRAGFPVALAELYRAEPVAALPGPAAAALGRGAIDAVLIFSRRGAEQLVSRLTELPERPRLGHVALHAISDKAAEPLAGLGFGRVRIALRPTAEALIDSLRPAP